MDIKPVDVMLVGYERLENLGLRSIKAYLEAHGRSVELIPFSPGNFENVLSAARLQNPVIIGFSIIFQYTLKEFRDVMNFLRGNGITSHFTAGGHFPSLRPADTLELIPELDSIVRFEGEITLLDLLKGIGNRGSWGKIPGLAFRDNGAAVVTEPRPLINDLDNLPLIYRDEPQQMPNGLNMASMLSSRGCLFNCSFCSIRSFYRSSDGLSRRTRSAGSVAGEMYTLYTEKNVRFFVFQDDDFAARTQSQRDWLMEFIQKLKEYKLTGKIAWKISCRVDDLDPEFLQLMIRNGLIGIYLGVESGNESGLQTLNKNTCVEQNIKAIELLKQNDVAAAIGFMLFDPSSTVETVRKNIDFLQSVGKDGYFPVNFCKMLPYAGTPIEEALRKTGRLTGSIAEPDYNFSDPVLNWYDFLILKVFSKRNFSSDGIVSLLQQAGFTLRLSEFFDPDYRRADYSGILRGITRDVNLTAIETLTTLLDEILNCGIDSFLKNEDKIIELFTNEWRVESTAEIRLKQLFVSANHQQAFN